MEMFEGIFQYRIIELNVCFLMLSSLITGSSTGRKTNGVKIDLLLNSQVPWTDTRHSRCIKILALKSYGVNFENIHFLHARFDTPIVYYLSQKAYDGCKESISLPLFDSMSSLQRTCNFHLRMDD